MTGLLLPVGLGLLGFVEPCSLGATLIFVTMLDGRPAATKVAQVGIFTVTRAAFLGLLRLLAAVAGGGFFAAQRGAWIGFGIVYVALGALLVTRRAGRFIHSVGPGMAWLSERRGAGPRRPRAVVDRLWPARPVASLTPDPGTGCRMPSRRFFEERHRP